MHSNSRNNTFFHLLNLKYSKFKRHVKRITVINSCLLPLASCNVMLSAVAVHSRVHAITFLGQLFGLHFLIVLLEKCFLSSRSEVAFGGAVAATCIAWSVRCQPCTGASCAVISVPYRIEADKVLCHEKNVVQYYLKSHLHMRLRGVTYVLPQHKNVN